jgi:hypothetical protein
MNVPYSKELGLFTIAAISVTHEELCLSEIQNSIFDRSVHYMNVATRAAQQPGLLVRKHSARGDLHWNTEKRYTERKHAANYVTPIYSVY